MRDLIRTHRTLTGLTLVAAAALWLAAAPASAQRAEPRGGGGARAPHAESGGRAPSGPPAAQGPARPRGSDRGTVGRAVPRGSVRGGTPYRYRAPAYVYGGYGYPWWGYGGIGFGLYGGYYGPYGWYDPWWYGGAYPSAYPGYYPGRYREGEVRLEVKPRQASVYVDGYYAGIVDDFDGLFQRLHLESGGHHIEIRLDGYQTLTVDLHVQPGRTVTYRGQLKKLP